MRALNIAATGMAAQNMRVEVISHNLANMNTTAYNARRAEFSDLHYQQVERPGTINSADGTVLPAGVQLGLGVRAAAVSMQVAQGALDRDRRLARPRHRGPGLPRDHPAERRPRLYPRRRAEAQRRRPDRHLGRLHGGARHHHPRGRARDQRSTPAGEVYAYFDGQTEAQLLGQFSLVTFTNEKGLEAIGSNLYRETEASGQAERRRRRRGRPRHLPPGLSRELRVDAVREITGLIEAQRGYELNAKVITAADQMLAATTQIR